MSRCGFNKGRLCLSVAFLLGLTQLSPAQVPTQGLKLWLKADAGVTLSSGRVSGWADQSGNAANAVQKSTSAQPVFVSNVANGKPIVRFDGISDFMTFTLPVSGLSQMTIVMVSAAAQSGDGGTYGTQNAALYWGETANWGTVCLSPFQRLVDYRFGTGQANNVPVYNRAASIATQFSVTTAIKNGGAESLYVDSVKVLSQTGKLTTIANTGAAASLGLGSGNTHFPGDIAEVLVYSRALADTERQQVESYLTTKYFGTAPAPQVNQPPTVSAGPDQTASLPASVTLNGSATDDGLPAGSVLTTTWSKVSGPGTVTFANLATPVTTATFSAAGTYVLQLAASDGQLTSTDQATITVNSSTVSIPTQNLKLWLRADAGVTLANSPKVAKWADQSGSGTDATQTLSANQPSLVSGVLNGKPVVRFDGASSYMGFTMPVNGLTAMTLVLVSATTQDLSPSSNDGSHAPLYWPETAGWGMLYLNPLQRYVSWRFGTGQGLNLPLYTRAASLGNQFSLSTVIKNGTTEAGYVNGQLVLTNSNAWATIANVSGAANLGWCTYCNTYFPGDIAEVLMYTRALSSTERQQVEQYLAGKYGSALTPPAAPVNQAPVVSAGPNQTITLPASANLSGTATDDGLPNGTLTTAWSKSSGPGTVTFGNANTLSTTVSFSAAGTYVLQLSASDGALTSSSSVTITVNPAASAPPTTIPPGAIVLNPGDNIQVAVNAHPQGSTFYLNAGVYRMQTVTPAAGDIFIGATDAAGKPAAILNGSVVIGNFGSSGSVWVATGQMPGGLAVDPQTGNCDSAHPRCIYLNDLFRDGVRLKHVSSQAALATGTWYFDLAANNIYVYDNPAGHTIELGLTTYAFPHAYNLNGVTVKNLVIEKYANPSGAGALDAKFQDKWVIVNNEIRNNHGGGANIGNSAQFQGNYVHHNGQIGILAIGNYIVIDGNEISYNNEAGYSYSWQAGGCKFMNGSTYFSVKNNWVHDNYGPGLWFDYGNQFNTMEGNRTARNYGMGLFYEMSYDGTIRYNISDHDGPDIKGKSIWYGAGILTTNSNRVTAYGNTILGSTNGLAAARDSRTGSNPYNFLPSYGEAFSVKALNYHDNMVVQTTGNGDAGGFISNDSSLFSGGNDNFTHNTYKLDNQAGVFYDWQGGKTFSQWQAAGQDTNGVLKSSTDGSFPSTKFAAGTRVQTIASTPVYSLPSTTDGALLSTLNSGAPGTVTAVAGPIYSGGLVWWQVQYDTGTKGWSPESNLQ